LVPRRQQRRDFALDFSHYLPADLAEALPKVVQPWIARMAEELSLAIGGLGIAASDPNVLYAATGEWTSGIGFPTDPVVTGVVGREFDVHPNQISTWKDQFLEDELRQQAVDTRGRHQGAAREDRRTDAGERFLLKVRSTRRDC
jgi:hypothetical protein